MRRRVVVPAGRDVNASSRIDVPSLSLPAPAATASMSHGCGADRNARPSLSLPAPAATASMSHGCGADRNAGPSLVYKQGGFGPVYSDTPALVRRHEWLSLPGTPAHQRWPMGAFRWSEFWSAPQRGPGRVMSPASASPGIHVSRHSGHSAQPAARSPEAGALYFGKNEGEVPPPPEQDLRDPPHSQRNSPMGHG